MSSGPPDGAGRTGQDRKGELTGSAKLDRRTKDLVKRLKSGDIAIINHRDIDAISAEELVESGVRAVINTASSTTGRYPNAGPLILADAGIPLIDTDGVDLFEKIGEGDQVRILSGEIYSNGIHLASGRVLDRDDVAEATEKGRREIGQALEEFAENTVSYLRQENGLLAGTLEFPHLETNFRDRHALIVVRGAGHKRDLKALKPYIRDVKPVLVAVDGGADAILDAGLKPDMIVGDMDSASDRALKSGAELVVHAYTDGSAPGGQRVERLGLNCKEVPAPGTSQDLAMLIAYEHGALLLVCVGSHFNLVEFLDKGRSGMSSTFLTRLRIGDRLVDTKGVSRLYRPAPGRGQLALLMGAALVTLFIIVLTSPQLERLADLFWLKLRILLGL